LIMRAESYLRESIDDYLMIKPWSEKNIPVFLRKIYKFYEMIILGKRCILLELVDETPSVDTIKKHIKRIEEITNLQIALYYKEITGYRRKSLIQNRISFIIEDGQMYLPFIGMDLNQAKDYKAKEATAFSTSAQLAYLYFLYNKDAVLNTTEFAKKLGLNIMTASRALNDLYNANLLIYDIGGKTGRSKEYHRISNPEYFEKGKPFIKSPIQKVVYVKNSPAGTLTAGLEALAEVSLINPPNYFVRAIGNEAFKHANIETIKNKDIVKDENPIELQVWNFDPKLFSEKFHVDIMSLYASLMDEKDERIEQALQEALRGEKWYMD